MHILLVEDDEMLGHGTQAGIVQCGYKTTWVKDGYLALETVKQNPNTYDAIVLDLGLPKLSGLKVLRQWRADGLTIPVIILTARDGIEDRVNGLDTGADDYLIKPIDLDELCARIRALQRRGMAKIQQELTSVLHYRNLRIDTNAHVVTLNGEIISTSRREFSLLQKLVEHAGQVLSREQLSKSVYGWHEEIDSNTLEVHVHNLRKKLNADYIRTIRGVGYMIDKEA